MYADKSLQCRGVRILSFGFFFFFFFEMNAKNIVKEPNCYKSLSNPNCIDLFTTNSSSTFQNTKTTSMGLYDFLKMVITVLKQTFPRSLPMKLVYKDSKSIDRLTIKRQLEKKLSHQINECKLVSISSKYFWKH